MVCALPLSRCMSGFKGRVKTDISQWHTTKYATMLPVWCLKMPKGHRVTKSVRGPTFPSTSLAFYQSMVSYLVARHRDMSVLHFGLDPDTDAFQWPPGDNQWMPPNMHKCTWLIKEGHALLRGGRLILQSSELLYLVSYQEETDPMHTFPHGSTNKYLNQWKRVNLFSSPGNYIWNWCEAIKWNAFTFEFRATKTWFI